MIINIINKILDEARKIHRTNKGMARMVSTQTITRDN